MTHDVVGLGCACLDFLGIVPHLPDQDDQIWMSDSTQQGGGMVSTALVTLSKLGVSTAFVGKVGNDMAGRAVKEEFDEYGVDSAHLIVEAGATTPVSMILVDESTGQRTIMAGGTTVEMSPSEIPTGMITAARYLHLDTTDRQAALAAARIAHDAGVPVVLDADSLSRPQDIEDLLRATDYLIASRVFAEALTGRADPATATKSLAGYGSSVTVVTLGEEGSYTLAGDRSFHTPAFSVEVVDTTGAGDVFHGAYTFGLLQGWSLEKTSVFSSAVAALNCTRLGGRTGIPDLRSALDFLRDRRSEHFNDRD
ncbi:MAG: carbohydrate kinase family protein [Gemmatimonadetes bacterium]|nr:carbohydrate kinase family protein [Gemmatimonadota bacterium]MYG86169.1 carbohydrate kinase family protein [Gemmatimonadota bacterium]MYJ90331.1 carbohydrate kinase family protein [Gemmatimonadota bacterium]